MLLAKNFTTQDVVCWNIAVYIRLSREDKNENDESLSVTNQRKIIQDYLKHTFQSEYTIVDYYVDDGKTGTDYNREEFQRLLVDIEAGKVNCIICKTLSRCFRNYADQGYFLESYFPQHGVRFISLGEPSLDSYLDPSGVQGMEAPIIGLMNDRYAYTTSMSVRRTFDTKRKNGEYIGAFAPFGYLKPEADKNSLVIDEEAAQIVKDIFNWFTVEGMSKNGIAKRLNAACIPNPTMYKKMKGFRYNNPHAKQNDGLWCPVTVSRILQNQTYIGNMVQGKQQVISYKVHDRVATPQSAWYIVENTHEAIIDKDTFELAQTLQQRHTRTAPKEQSHYLFSGFVRCADCRKAMTRRSSKGLVYYACRTNVEKSTEKCSRHSIREDVLKKAVLVTIQKQIELVSDISQVIDTINRAPLVRTKSKRLEKMLQQQQTELNKVNSVLDSLYLDWKSGEITREQYHRLKADHNTRAEQLKQSTQELQEEIHMMEQGIQTDNPYLETFLKYRNIQSLNRGILAELVQNIFIHEDKSITIEFTFANEYQHILDFIEANQQEKQQQLSIFDGA